MMRLFGLIFTHCFFFLNAVVVKDFFDYLYAYLIVYSVAVLLLRKLNCYRKFESED